MGNRLSSLCCIATDGSSIILMLLELNSDAVAGSTACIPFVHVASNNCFAVFLGVPYFAMVSFPRQHDVP